MQHLPEPSGAGDAVPLKEGLPLQDVRRHLERGLLLRDTGHRILAFYLAEMSERRLCQASGHSSTAHYAEQQLGLDRRRTAELIAVGKKLLLLPSIDGAFFEGRIGWAKVLQLAKVATPEHEEAWLDRALALSCRELTLEVRLSKPGSAPREPGERKGLPDVRFRVTADLDVVAWEMLETAKKKLSAELGRPVTDAELLKIALELLLNTEEDGTIPGRTRVDASLYRVVLRSDSSEEGEPEDERQGAAEGLTVDTELGPVPIDGVAADDPLANVRSACVRCDGECVGHGDEPLRDVPTPPALRRRVLARDGARCRCCRSRRQLMVHHIRYRSKGGRTRAANLITLCASCHALVHADLLVLVGEHADRIAFHDADGKQLGAHEEPLRAEVLARLVEPHTSAERSAPRGGGARADPEQQSPPREQPPPVDKEAAFAGIVGQDALIDRLDLAVRGSKARGRTFPHTLFVGPAGTGKTTLARAIAARLGARLVETSGPLLQDMPGLFRTLHRVGPGDVLFLDEVHAVPRPVLEALYQVMVECRLTEQASFPRFTVVAATTEQGDLPGALRSRFGLQEDLTWYATDTLRELIVHAAAEQGVCAERSAAERLAEGARGTPREALRLLDRALDVVAARDAPPGGHAALESSPSLDLAAVDTTLAGLGYDAAGLLPAERRYLRVLGEARDPVPLHRLARMLGASARTVLECLEPYLFRRGLVRMTPRGRVAAPRRTFGARTAPAPASLATASG